MCKLFAVPLSIRICLPKKRSISYGRGGGVMRVPCVRWGWTCARGNRVCCGVCAVMVGMYVSYSVYFFIIKNRSANVVFLLENTNFKDSRHLFLMNITLFSAKKSSSNQSDMFFTQNASAGIFLSFMQAAISAAVSPPFRQTIPFS